MGAATASDPAFEVSVYSESVLETQLCNRDVSAELIAKKRQVAFLKEYLKHIDARTVIVEHRYIDRDFMEDFAAYYVRCFANYERKCKRLHFFSTTFTDAQFSKLIATGLGELSVAELQEHYLGFIAVKPLPDTVIGRTCLGTYPLERGRHYDILRHYDANLFGIPLRVKTLAFQEQDRVVAACASSALWTAFHGTSQKFSHRLLSPAEITTAAGAKASDVDRNLPSKGLTWNMMADAIRHVGLEPLYLQPADDDDLKATIYGYVHGGVPAMLGFFLHDPADGPEAWERQAHAVTVGGYRINGDKPVKDKLQFSLYAYRIDRLFVHDDQVGPFARMHFDGKACRVSESGKEVDRRSLGTIYDQNNLGLVRAIYTVVLLPLYHKIRIPYSLVHDTVFNFTFGFLKMLQLSQTDQTEVGRFSDLEWDIYLTTANDFKEELAKSTAIESDRKFRYLTRSLPRFLWRAKALVNNVLALDLLFDATDIEQGNLFSLVVEYDPYLAAFMPVVLGEKKNEALFDETPARRIVDWYIEAAKQ